MENINEKSPITYKNPAEEVSFLIRSCEDAVRLAEILRDFCLEDYLEDMFLIEANKLLTLVQYWDAPLRAEAWDEICDLCGLMNEAAEQAGYDEEKYKVIATALKYAAKRNQSESKARETQDRLLNQPM